MRDSSWYRTGTASLTNGSDVVTGVSTGWTPYVSAGDIFLHANAVYEVLQVLSDTSIKLDRAFAGATVSGQAYAIIRSYSAQAPAALANRVSSALQRYHNTMDQLLTWMSGGGDGTLQTMTLDDFGGVSGLLVPTLPGIAPTSVATSVTPAAGKIPKAGTDGKIDPNWLPADILEKLRSGGNITEKLVTLVQPDTGTAALVVNSKDAAVYDIYLKRAATIDINYVNDTSGVHTNVHNGVAETAAMTMTLRIFTLAAGASATFTGPLIWESGSAPVVPSSASHATIITLTWFNTAAAGAGAVATPVNKWIGHVSALNTAV